MARCSELLATKDNLVHAQVWRMLRRMQGNSEAPLFNMRPTFLNAVTQTPSTNHVDTSAGRVGAFGSGKDVRRVEDDLLLKGSGQFTDDVTAFKKVGLMLKRGASELPCMRRSIRQT